METSVRFQYPSENTLIKEEETSLLLSMVDINILQNIFIDLVDGREFSIDKEEEEMKESFNLLLNFCLSCKLFFKISKQPLFPLILNNININLNYKKYLKILFVIQKVETDDYYKEKDIDAIFYLCCYLGYFDLINTLIKYGANINHLQRSNTPLIVATINRRIKTVKKLFKFKNLNINQQDKSWQRTALYKACRRGNEDIVKILLSRKDIDINIKDKSWQRTALMDACIAGKEDIVKILLSRKDNDINIKDKFGNTALDIAKENNYENIVNILENYQS